MRFRTPEHVRYCVSPPHCRSIRYFLIHKRLFFEGFCQRRPPVQIWHSLCLIQDSACSNLWRDIMSEFSILYRSLHCEQKESKKVEKNDSSCEVKGEAQSKSTVNPLPCVDSQDFLSRSFLSPCCLPDRIGDPVSFLSSSCHPRRLSPTPVLDIFNRGSRQSTGIQPFIGSRVFAFRSYSHTTTAERINR